MFQIYEKNIIRIDTMTNNVLKYPLNHIHNIIIIKKGVIVRLNYLLTIIISTTTVLLVYLTG